MAKGVLAFTSSTTSTPAAFASAAPVVLPPRVGDVFVPMKLVGVRADGSPRARGHATFTILVDPGASKTIVSEAVARRVGIRRMGEGHMSGAGGLVRVDLGLALALVEGCHPEPLVVGIDDGITDAAGAEVVMGHRLPPGRADGGAALHAVGLLRGPRTSAEAPQGLQAPRQSMSQGIEAALP